LTQVKLIDDENRLKYAMQAILETENILHQQDSRMALDYAKWKWKKAEIKFVCKPKELFILNNQIYWAHLGINIGSEQSFDRPVLIVRTTKNSTVCTVIPLTLERVNDDIPYHINLENGKSVALIEQIRTISKDRIYDYHYENQKYATITGSDWAKINEQLTNLYTLKPLFNKTKQ